MDFNVTKKDDAGNICMCWIGDHTMGIVGMRGTRVWFRPNACFIVDAMYSHPTERGIDDIIAQIKDEHSRVDDSVWDSVNRESFTESDIWNIYPGNERFNMIGKDINAIIEQLKQDGENPQDFSNRFWGLISSIWMNRY